MLIVGRYGQVVLHLSQTVFCNRAPPFDGTKVAQTLSQLATNITLKAPSRVDSLSLRNHTVSLWNALVLCSADRLFRICHRLRPRSVS